MSECMDNFVFNVKTVQSGAYKNFSRIFKRNFNRW